MLGQHLFDHCCDFVAFSTNSAVEIDFTGCALIALGASAMKVLHLRLVELQLDRWVAQLGGIRFSFSTSRIYQNL